MINVSTSLKTFQENLVSASKDSNTITDKSLFEGCFPTLIPFSSKALNSLIAFSSSPFSICFNISFFFDLQKYPRG